MAVASKKADSAKNKVELHVMPSLLRDAEQFSASEGVSLTQFINVAIAERVARLENQRWALNRKPFDEAARLDALDLLYRGGNQPPEPGDEIPPEYLAWRKRKAEGEKKAANQGKPR